MRITRVRTDDGIWLADIGSDSVGLLQKEADEPWADSLRSWLAAGKPASQRRVDRANVSLLAPVRAPQKIIAVGLNYKDHAAEQHFAIPQAPMFFNKSPGSIIASGEAIEFSATDSSAVDYEAELAVVVGETTRNVAQSEAIGKVLGYTVCNDVSARDAQRADGQFFRAKSFDTFCPLGPWIVTTDDIENPGNLAVRSTVNGDLRQNGSTSDLIFDVPTIISYASRFLTLEAGDVITTGTPAGVGSGMTPPVFLNDGDVVMVEISEIGAIRNPVVVHTPSN